jgi:hypothetical protein
MISTKDPEFLEHLLLDFPNLMDNIEIYDAKNRKELLTGSFLFYIIALML